MTFHFIVGESGSNLFCAVPNRKVQSTCYRSYLAMATHHQ